MRYTLSQIAQICGGEHVGVDVEVCDIVTDSRSCVFGDGAMFVAMKGVNHDSHNFIADMYQCGVRAFLVERDINIDTLSGSGYVLVRNSLEALQHLAAYHREHFNGVVVGITGSNGKTVVKEWAARSLPQIGRAHV